MEAVLTSLQSLETQYIGAGSAMRPLPYTPFRHYAEKAQLLDLFNRSEEFRDYLRNFGKCKSK